MRLLLDTHVFLWYIADDPKLPAKYKAAIEDPNTEPFLSVVSV
jgi:PIN domain nuclease of toxin-antitoxin system